MSMINGGMLFVLIIILGAAYGLFSFFKNQKKRKQPRTPIQKAQDAWCKTRKGSEEERLAEKRWEELAIEEMKAAKSLCDLYNALERSLTYTIVGYMKRHNNRVISEFYKVRYKEIVAEDARNRLETTMKLRVDTQGRALAPHPKKINEQGKGDGPHFGQLFKTKSEKK